MPFKIAMYGDSYMTRLRHFCNNDLRMPGKIYWYEKGGLRAEFKKRDGQSIDTEAEVKYASMLELQPDVAFLNVSGNDITTQTMLKEIFDRVDHVVHELRDASATKVFIAEILARGDFSKSPDPNLYKATFDRKRQKIDALLAKHYQDNLIRFPDIRYPADYFPDLVHLLPYSQTTNNTGMKKYECRIRRILCSLRY